MKKIIVCGCLLVLPLMTLARPIKPDNTWQTFQSKQWGFSLRYPPSVKRSTTFNSAYLLPNHWRNGQITGPQAIGKGQAVVQLTAANLKTHHYPRYFIAELRVGVSRDPIAVQHCLQPGPLGKTLPVTLSGVPFQTFPIKDAAMMQYLDGVSYRAVHQGTCYAIELFTTGSSYRDPKPSPQDLGQPDLDHYSTILQAVLDSFAFDHSQAQ